MIEPVFEKGYPCWEAVNRGHDMTDNKQLEMRMHKLDEKIGRLASDFENIRNDLKDLEKEIGGLFSKLREIKKGIE